jgi:hypothetical protein
VAIDGISFYADRSKKEAHLEANSAVAVAAVAGRGFRGGRKPDANVIPKTTKKRLEYDDIVKNESDSRKESNRVDWGIDGSSTPGLT